MKTFFLLLTLAGIQSAAAAGSNTFTAAVEAYRAGDYERAAQTFRTVAADAPSVGALQNLGAAEWQRGRAGEAIVAWEQALWINPYDASVRNNLRFARETAQLESPELTWCEEVSLWLPVNVWAWITAFSLWLAVGILTLPGVLRISRAPWQQAVAALSLGVFLVSLPAHYGTFTRSRLGFVLEKNTPLRLTPTAEAEAVTRLAAGEPVREVRRRGRYVLLRTNRSVGWVEEKQFARIGPG